MKIEKTTEGEKLMEGQSLDLPGGKSTEVTAPRAGAADAAAEGNAAVAEPRRVKWLQVAVSALFLVGVLWYATSARNGAGASMFGNKAGATRTVALPGGAKMELVWCPPGKFMMGSASGDNSESPVHEVAITKGFWIGKYEVTQEQWKRVMGYDHAMNYGKKGLPYENVTWVECQQFCKKAGHGLRLPTEAEWEYACRAGTSGRYAGVVEEMAWNYDNCGNRTHPVGTKKPNEWGIHDMYGNVSEWCQDWFEIDYYQRSPVKDPTGPASGDIRVYRGGSFVSGEGSCNSASRYGVLPDIASAYRGFRVAVSQD